MNWSVVFLLFFISCAASPTKRSVVKSLPHENGFIGETLLQAVTIDHKYFTITYDQETRLAKYVVYKLTAEQLKKKKASRKNKFIPDPILVEQGIPFVMPTEYSHSGYDQGHLAPAADFAWDQKANDITFVMSNMAPQTPGLNRDAWRRLEERVRKWACGEGELTVITGILTFYETKRLKSGLRIPQKFYKIIIDETSPRKAIAFVYDQTDKGEVAMKRIISVAQIEKKTGISTGMASRKPASIDDWKSGDCF